MIINSKLSANYCRAVADRLRRDAEEMIKEASVRLKKAQEWEDAANERSGNGE